MILVFANSVMIFISEKLFVLRKTKIQTEYEGQQIWFPVFQVQVHNIL